MTLAPATSPSSDLRRLSRLYGLQTSYRGVDKQQHATGADSLISVLAALGAPVASGADVADALAARERERWEQMLEPVIVAWDGVPPSVEVRLPARAGGALDVEIVLENGKVRRWKAGVGRLRRLGGTEAFSAYTLSLRSRLPSGYHRLNVRSGRRKAEALVVSAPARAYTGEGRGWGCFLPLYALHSERSWGAGDFTDLAELATSVGGMGGSAVATLPLFAAFLGEPFEPSPYAPASRLFWNEFYLDPTAVPEFSASAGAREIVGSAAFGREIAALQASDVVDYGKGMALKRRVLAEMAKVAFGSPERERQLQAFVRQRPEAEDYARFRAVTERRRKPWQAWPARLRDGRIEAGDYADEARRYHLYVQLLAHEQLSALRKRADRIGVGLFLDLPLGSTGDSYDVWRERDSFVLGLHGGAPPDTFFSHGQNWGFPPSHPENIRRNGYRYLRALLGNVLTYARSLRFDHVMGLHRLFVIPRGMGAGNGVYVRYRPEEMYAVLSLESHRHKAPIVGEDLGTVPNYVHTAMSRHAIHRTYVVQYESSPRKPLPKPRRLSVASLNTHDMPPFASWWQALDTADRLDLGLLDDNSAEEERTHKERIRQALARELRRRKLLKGRDPQLKDILKAVLLALGDSRAKLVVANLEDLWLETRQQNVPGTMEERVNWRHKSKHTLDGMMELPEVKETLRELNGVRRRRRSR